MSTYIAQINATTIPTYFPPARYFTSIGALVNTVVPALLLVAAIILLGMLLLAGYRVLTAAGNPDAITEARNTATFAIVGIVVIMLSYLIVRVVSYILGVDALV